MLRRVLALCVCLGLFGCRDRDAEALARAELQYRELIAASAMPTDARFDAVLTELQSISDASKHATRAKRLRDGIEAARRGRVRTPLALGANGRRPPELEAQLRACARLAELAGVDGGINHDALVALEQCRKQAEKMELEFAHGPEDGGHL